MHKRINIAVFIALFATAISNTGCEKVTGKGPVVSETRNSTSFSALNYAIQGNLYYEPSTEYSIEIRAQRNILDVIETYVSNNELQIRVRNNTHIHSHEPIDIYVKAPDLSGFTLSGSGSIRIGQPLAADKLRFESSGSGNITAEEINAKTFESNISGSGKMEIRTGHALKQNINISGSGIIEYSGVQTDTAFTESSGSGDITIWVNKYLESRISGSGMVRYKGAPQVKVKISGSGKVEPF